MNYRDWLQQVIYKIINPVVRGMIKIGITPNFITTTGLVLNIVAAGVLIYGGINGERRAYRHRGKAAGAGRRPGHPPPSGDGGHPGPVGVLQA